MQSGGIKGAQQCCLLCGLSSEQNSQWGRQGASTRILLHRGAKSHQQGLFMIALQALHETVYGTLQTAGFLWNPQCTGCALNNRAYVCPQPFWGTYCLESLTEACRRGGVGISLSMGPQNL